MAAPELLSAYPAYTALQSRARSATGNSIDGLLCADERRARDFTVRAAGLELDFSRHLLDRDTLTDLLALADQAGIQNRIRALMSREHLNNTEDRPALHMLLRAQDAHGLDELFTAVRETRKRMRQLACAVNDGEWRGFGGERITDVVNIGIGGSDLGPRLVSEALRPFQTGTRCHYVANVDPADLQDVLRPLDGRTTLFIICSKSFRTEETLTNALAAREWLLEAGAQPHDLENHFLAVTANVEAAEAFGIARGNCLPMWDWVGGRYSVWSAVGLSCAVTLGWTHFEQLLAGARAMDTHFQDSEPAANMPLLMSLLEIWYSNFLGAGSHAILPYCHHLRRLPDYLQQLTMESNGKRVNTSGESVDYPTAPVLWGAAGTMGQHSFFQLLHQGTRLCPVDFVLPLKTHTGLVEQHTRLVANCLAQARALMVGRSRDQALASLLGRGIEADRAEQLAPHLVMPGNRPSSILSMEALTPETLGALLALYEHRTFCSAQLWGVNPFDQWGVELGKEIGEQVLERLTGGAAEPPMDTATERFIGGWPREKE